MDVYRQIVPQLHAPDSTLLSSIIDAVILHEAFEYLPQLWNDAILLDLETSAKVVEKILHGISLNKMEDSNLQKNFVKIGKDIHFFCSKINYIISQPLKSYKNLINIDRANESEFHLIALSEFFSQQNFLILLNSN